MTHGIRTHQLVPTGEATAILLVSGSKPITVIDNETVRATFDDVCL